jgi:hypothetical protein
MMAADSYNDDLRLWAEQQAKLLREGNLAIADLDNIAEELESLATRQDHELGIRMESLCTLMLLWELEPDLRRPMGYSQIVEERLMIETLLEVSPSLSESLPRVLDKEYARAANAVQLDTRRSDILDTCAWTFEPLMERALDSDRPLPWNEACRCQHLCSLYV